jgi:hypothetical protein
MRKVIDQERTKPLEVTKDFVLSYEKKEKERSNKLSEHVDRHIETLRALRQKVETRSETMARSNVYRQWRKEFNPKKNAVLLGKTLDETDLQSSKIFKRGKDNSSSSDSVDRDIERYTQTSGKTNNNANKDLMNVLNSLQKLSELENRISSLETNNEYASLLNDEKSGAEISASTTFRFKKQRNYVGTDKAMKMTYSLNLSKGRANTYASKPIKPKHGAARLNPISSRTSVNQQKRGVFITEFDSSNNHNSKYNRNSDQTDARYVFYHTL